MVKTADLMRERLADALAQKGITPRALSLAIGANHSYVSQLLNGKGGQPSAMRLARMAEELDVSAEWLAGSSSTREPVRSEVSLADRHLEWRGPAPQDPPIPLVGTGDCADMQVCTQSGELVQIERASFDPDYHVRYIARPPALRGALELYAIYFHGDSMSPRFEAGEVAIVDPRRPAGPGDDVVVQLRENGDEEVTSVIVKRLVRRARGMVTLQQFNPPLVFDVPAEKVKRLHRIVPQTELLF